MEYWLTSLGDHLDFGFGITAETYYNSAKYMDEGRHKIQAFQLIEMPINFLYRHSIELALKSLIIIFHKKLSIPYENDSCESTKPKILSQGKWRPLYSCHWIDELYRYWKDELLLKNITRLESLANKGDWKEYEDITKAIPIIAKYDKQSSFFRYPVTENPNLDLEKFTMKEVDIETLRKIFEQQESMKEKESGGNVILAIKNDNDEIIKAYRQQKELLTELSDSLKKVAHYFYCIHIMTRIELCKGK